MLSETAARRVMATLKHLEDCNLARQVEPSDCSVRPMKFVKWSEDDLKWNGWGYEDTEFRLDEASGLAILAGNKYELSGKLFPKFRSWIEGFVDGIDVNEFNPPQEKEDVEIPDPILNRDFLDYIDGRYGRIEFDGMQRLRHGHGQTAQEVWLLRYSKYNRIPDVVIWPINHEQVQFIVSAARDFDVCIIPFGGGTTVSEALLCPENEDRMIVSLDMKMMNHIKWVDRESLMACVEAGAVGRELEANLGSMGFVFGHEPDSHEFSTLGGWVATKASGMKKNVYGNIEDLVIHIKMATAVGTVERNCSVPRLSTGPDVQTMLIGSEGIFGVVTEVVIKLRPLPEARAYGSIVFPDFETGVAFMREIALKRCAPASIRLMDNTQFQMGQCMTPEGSRLHWLTEPLKNAYLTKWAKFDLEKMVACTILFEGDKKKVQDEQRVIYALADKHNGISGGETNGRKGYFLTFMIAYLRDYGFGYWLIGESFETSIPWANVLECCYRVKDVVESSGEPFGLPFAPMCSYRVTQCYDTGACVYFYFGFIFRTLSDPLEKFTQIECIARDEIIKCGGSLSHHHGVGKLRMKWLPECISPVGCDMLKALKQTVDPTNVFGNGNLIGVVGRQKPE